jgi:hypothetical protein
MNFDEVKKMKTFKKPFSAMKKNINKIDKTKFSNKCAGCA